jgi:subtilisin family serine protease
MSERTRSRMSARFVALLSTLLLVASMGLPAGASPGLGAQPVGAFVDERLEAEVAEAAEAGERAQVVMVLEASAEVERYAGDRDAVIDHLKTTAEESQLQLEQHLMENRDARGDPRIVNRFWIQNMVLVEFEPSASGLDALAAVPGVQRLVPNFEVAQIEPEQAEVSAATVDGRTWGVDRIEAHRVHDELGLDGSGVRVATLDTGVAIDHPDLAGKMVTDDPNDPAYPGGWMEFDGSGNLVASNPHDSSDHGTHVSGTIHGGDASDIQIGVAPGADMMHGLVIPGGGGTFVQVAAGMQWAIDPVDANGNPAGEPADVVNMSLGGCGIFQEMVEPTRNMRAADVFPAFAIGNAGFTCPNCGTYDTSSPGNVYEAVGVGATDIDDDVAAFSCGSLMHKDDWPQPPADWPDTYMKPDLSAPGVAVLSTMPDGSYAAFSGTSMAAPHVAGAVALMLEAAPGMGVDAVETQLADTSFFDDRHGTDRPNDRFGHGRINAFAATEPIALDSGITGTVTDADTGDPIAGATVATDTRSTTTGDDGTYTLRLEPGTYTLDADAFGYDPTTIPDIEVPDDQTFTQQDIELTPAPAGNLEGTVTLDDTGHGVPGVTIEIQGTNLTTTTDTDGNYHIGNIPVGDYTITADAVGFPNPPDQNITINANETTTANFTLEVPALEIGVMGTSTARSQGSSTITGWRTARSSSATT